MLKTKENGLNLQKRTTFNARELEKLDKKFWRSFRINITPRCYIVVIDSKHEEIPVKEAAIAHIPVISLSNTDCDISTIEYLSF